jgi:hypothetical protein
MRWLNRLQLFKVIVWAGIGFTGPILWLKYNYGRRAAPAQNIDVEIAVGTAFLCSGWFLLACLSGGRLLLNRIRALEAEVVELRGRIPPAGTPVADGSFVSERPGQEGTGIQRSPERRG